MTVFINARFLGQPLSGVQRYAREVLGALDQLLARDDALRASLGPVVALHPGQVADPGWSQITLRPLRGGRGHLWEQGALARAARGGVLVSLGNCGPLLHPRHLLCLHDANIWTVPGAFSPAYRLLHRALRPGLARRAAGLITVSRYSARALGRRVGVPPDEFRVIGNSAGHLARVAPQWEALQQHGLRRGEYLLTVGNCSENKNLARLIAAHGCCGGQVPPLVIAGGAVPGVEGDALPTSARIRALGRVSDGALRALYEGASGFVFPSLSEGFGIPPLEAMQFGVPVLAARSGALPEVLGDAPLWFDPLQVPDIARALSGFADMGAATRAEMAARGRAQAARFSWNESASRLAEEIARLQQPDARREVSTKQAA